MSRMRVDNRDIKDAQIFEILLDNFPDIIHSVDDSGSIVFTNKKAESLLGYTRDELLSMNVRQIYADEILKDVDKGFTKLKKAGDFSVESILKARDGTRIPVEIRSFSIYDDSGQFLRTFSILRDIRPIKELQNSLVHSGRLAAIGEMAAGVAHDINNPLTVILLANQMMGMVMQKEGAADRDKYRKHLASCQADIKRASQSIEKLVSHLRNFSRGMVEKRETVDIYNTVTDSLFITANKAKQCQVTAESRVCKGIHFTEGCPNQLEQVFVNIIANAYDAMVDRPTRQLVVSMADATRDNMEYWKCDITDTGGGIPKNILEDIFQAFFTTKAKGKGTGLGLSISRGIIKEHNGDIQVVSEVGKGSTFSIFLRKVQPPA